MSRKVRGWTGAVMGRRVPAKCKTQFLTLWLNSDCYLFLIDWRVSMALERSVGNHTSQSRRVGTYFWKLLLLGLSRVVGFSAVVSAYRWVGSCAWEEGPACILLLSKRGFGCRNLQFSEFFQFNPTQICICATECLLCSDLCPLQVTWRLGAWPIFLWGVELHEAKNSMAESLNSAWAVREESLLSLEPGVYHKVDEQW